MNERNAIVFMVLTDFALKMFVDHFLHSVQQFNRSQWNRRKWDITLRLLEKIEEFFKIKSTKNSSKNFTTKDEHLRLEDELGDVLFSVVTIANKENIKLEKTIINTLEKYNSRDKDRWNKKNKR